MIKIFIIIVFQFLTMGCSFINPNIDKAYVRVNNSTEHIVDAYFMGTFNGVGQSVLTDYIYCDVIKYNNPIQGWVMFSRGNTKYILSHNIKYGHRYTIHVGYSDFNQGYFAYIKDDGL